MKSIFMKIMLITGIFLTLLGLIQNCNRPTYSYNVVKNTDYKILLKPNNFYDKNILPANLSYNSSSIKKIDISFKYKFKGNKKTNLNYKYNIKATLVGFYNKDADSTKIWNKVLNIKNGEKKVLEKSFNIKEKVSIDYDYYYNMLKDYENTYRITIDGFLKIRLNIVLQNNINKKINDYVELIIPINDTVTDIEKKHNSNFSKTIFLEKENYSYIIGIVFIIFSLIPLMLKKLNFKRNKINTLLKIYEEIIVKVKNTPDIDNLKLIYVYNFDDLVNVANQTYNNIIYDGNNFYIILDNYVYIYKKD